jgi:hypothetical protein
MSSQRRPGDGRRCGFRHEFSRWAVRSKLSTDFKSCLASEFSVLFNGYILAIMVHTASKYEGRDPMGNAKKNRYNITSVRRAEPDIRKLARALLAIARQAAEEAADSQESA